MAFDYSFHTENSQISGGIAAGDKVPIFDNSAGRWYYATTEDFRAGSNNGLVDCTASTLTVTKSLHSGSVVTLNRAAGITVTLPAASGTGDCYRFIIGTTVTSNSTIIKVANSSDSFCGFAIQAADGGSTSNMWEIATNDDTITFNGTTTGGIKGDYVEIIDIGTNIFHVRVQGAATGTEATPFSATV